MYHHRPYNKMYHQPQSHYDADSDLPEVEGSGYNREEMRQPQPEPDLPEPAKPILPDTESQEAPASEAGTESKDELAEAKAKLEEERLRMVADMENFKKRLAREHQEQMRYASEKVLSDLLPALDNLDLAIQYGAKHEACADMMQGIEMTRRQLLDVVAKSGLVMVGKEGEQFDPALHEAIGMEQNPQFEKGAVSRVLQSGYKLQDRLLRPAKVMVNN